MDAVGKIDLQALAALAVLDHFVDRGRTEELAWIAVFVRAARVTNIRLEDVEVARLIFIVSGAGIVDIRQLVESQLAVAFVET